MFSHGVPKKERGFYIGFVPYHVVEGDLIHTKLEIVRILERPQVVNSETWREDFNVVFPSRDKFAQAVRACHANWYKYILQTQHDGEASGGMALPGSFHQPGVEGEEAERQMPPLMQAFGASNVSLAVRTLAKTRVRMQESKAQLPEFALFPSWHRAPNGVTGVNLQFFEL